jgi:hypothetical protein
MVLEVDVEGCGREEDKRKYWRMFDVAPTTRGLRLMIDDGFAFADG